MNFFVFIDFDVFLRIFLLILSYFIFFVFVVVVFLVLLISSFSSNVFFVFEKLVAALWFWLVFKLC